MEDRNDDKIVDYMLDTCQVSNKSLYLVGVVYRDDDDSGIPEEVQVTLIPGYNDQWTYFDAVLPELFLDGSIEMISHRAIQFTAHVRAGAGITRTIEFKSAAWGRHPRYTDWLYKRLGISDDDAEDLGEMKDGDDFDW